MVTIAHVLRPQGRRGEVLAVPLSDRPGRFDSIASVFLPGPSGRGRQVAVSGCWPHKGRVVVKLEGVDSIADAEALRGVDLRVPESELVPLPDGTYYHHQLQGLDVVDESGVAQGRVQNIIETGGTNVLAVATSTGEKLVPLAAAFLRYVDLENRRVVIRFPDWETDEHAAH